METNAFDSDSPPTTPLYEETLSTSPSSVSEQSAADAGSPAGDNPDSDGGGSMPSAAKEQAQKVSEDAKEAAGRVAGVTKDQAERVGAEATSQTKKLLGEATDELKGQAAEQQKKVAAGLRSVGNELGDMADGSSEGGVAAELVRALGDRADSVAGWLDGRDPGSLLREVKQFAARKPGTFIAIAAGAGLLAGRLSKSLITANATDDDSTTAPGSAPTTEDISFSDRATDR